MKKLTNLMKAIEKLNAPVVVDGETFESQFEFKIDGNNLYDAKENYYVDYIYEQYEMFEQLCHEFGYVGEFDWTNRVEEKLLKALRKDLGEDAYLDWEDNVRMIICE